MTVCGLSGWSLFEYVVVCHALWWISYYFLYIVSRQSEEWCCRVLTFVHGCLISLTAIKDLMITKEGPNFQNIPLSETQKSYLSIMLSYFLFDFCWFHFFGNEPWVIYIHHVCSILIISKILESNAGGGGISYGVVGLEFTNPYLQLRWFLRSHGYMNTPLYTAVELWFFCLFFFIRTVGGTISLYYAVIIPEMKHWMKVSFTSIYIISLVLQWQIFVFFKKKYWSVETQARVFDARSRVSISQYFQRRTLDPGPGGNNNEAQSVSTTSVSTSNFFPRTQSPKIQSSETQESKEVSEEKLEDALEVTPFRGSLYTRETEMKENDNRTNKFNPM